MMNLLTFNYHPMKQNICLYHQNGYFYRSFEDLNKKYKKDEKDGILIDFYDYTQTLILFWNDIFEDFKIMMINDSPLIKKYKYFRKNFIKPSTSKRYN